MSFSLSLDPALVFNMMFTATGQTLYMTFFGTIGAYLLGMPLGIMIAVTDKDGIKPNNMLNMAMGTFVNIMRSVPFLLLVVVAVPLTRFIAGTMLGYKATTVALVIASFAFVARMVESSIKEVDKGVIEAALSMGASTFQIIYKVLVVEARSSLILGAAISATTILSFSAMAGILGGDGLGFVAISYGYYRFQRDIMWIAVILIVALVMVGQYFGNLLARKVDKR